jgi:hypothetical protein
MSRTTTAQAVQRSSHAAQRPPALAAPLPPTSRSLAYYQLNAGLCASKGYDRFCLSGVQGASASLTKSPPGGNGAEEILLDAATYYQQVLHVTCQTMWVGRLSPLCEIGPD